MLLCKLEPGKSREIKWNTHPKDSRDQESSPDSQYVPFVLGLKEYFEFLGGKKGNDGVVLGVG